MSQFPLNKLKIINDPVYGFIKIPFELAFYIIEHPVFQRLRRIRQMGMAHYVYPGANHSRFQHALGAMHLMGTAIDIIRSKGHEITEQEAEAAIIAILLHDIGHGPFSHSLEQTLIKGVHHEQVSLLFMEKLNREFEGQLTLAIKIFKGEYDKRFLHQLVSGQIDVDRLDYLRRDSFFTGVTEGAVGSDRIIKMLEVMNDELVVEEKGIYSIEKFLVARRLMYWQVYLHKGVLAADQLLNQMLWRAHDLAKDGLKLFATPALTHFLYNMGEDINETNRELFLNNFTALDDNDIISAAKVWSKIDDPVLSYLCSGFVNRQLPRIEISNTPFPVERIRNLKAELVRQEEFDASMADYLITTDSISNQAYSPHDDNIKIRGKDGNVKNIQEVSDILNIPVLSASREKFYLCYPKSLSS